MNLAQLVEECERQSSYNDPAFRSYWKAFLNSGIREFARIHPWPGLEDILTLSSDGTEFLVLPHFIDDIVNVHNMTDGIPVIPLAHFERDLPHDYAARSAGQVVQYFRLGDVPALRAPTGYIYGQSSSPSDIDTIFVTGQVANSGASGSALGSTLKTISVAGAGTSPVTLSALFTQILSISRTTEANGDFMFFDAGAANAHISFMSQYETSAKFHRIQLFRPPSAQTRFEVRFRYKIPPIRNDYQAPPPAVDDDYLISHALERFYKQKGEFQKSMAQRAMTKEVLELKANKEHNFSEDDNRIYPIVEDDPDA